MDSTMPAYGLWLLVVLNSAVFVIFAFSFFKPQTLTALRELALRRTADRVDDQMVDLLRELQRKRDLTYMFISHDLSVVAHISDRVAVMYAGKIVELAPTEVLFAQPRHPYTEALLSAVLEPDPQQRRSETRIRLEGEVADPANSPSGCAFHPRCRYAQERCKHEPPALRELPSGALVACHYADELHLAGINIPGSRPHPSQEAHKEPS